ncbi:MAG: efflux RND transporter permease subunit [Candidatus Omnitrophota bacterium]
MSLPHFSVDKPVTTSMIFVGILLLGVISLTRLPQELFPSVNFPQLTIVTTYENAAPEEVETLITKIIEETVGTVGSIKRVSSISKEGVSIVTAEFNWGTNMDFASLGVREKIDLVKERLPLGSADPIVMKFNPFELPVVTLSVTGKHSPAELLRLSRKFIKDELEKVEGVASCSVNGGLEREILVSVDAGRLYASKIAITKIVDGLRSSNLNYPAGTIEEHFYEYLIRTMGEFKLIPEIQETIIGKDEEEDKGYMNPNREEAKTDIRASRLILLKDVAEIKDTFQEKTNISRYNGKENISVSVQKQASANTLRVADKVRDKLEDIKRDLPKGMDVTIIYDQSIFIKKSISGVMDAAVQGGMLAFIVLFVFLRNVKASFVVAFSMPVSIMVAFTLMYFNGITLNMLSLGGLALGIGMLVDNAIVVIENIYVHFNRTRDMKESSKFGASEMSANLFSSTLTTVAVFLPMVFVVGVAGQLFKELAFTVIFSLLASLLVALSLIPRLAAMGGSNPKKVKAISTANFTFGLGPIYNKFIPIVLRFRWLFLLFVMGIFVLSIGLFPFIDKEFMPKVDQREFIMRVNMPNGTRLNITDRVVKRVENILLETKELEGIAVTIGSSKSKGDSQSLEMMSSSQSQIIVALKKDRKLAHTSKVIERLKDQFDKLNLEGAEIEYILQESFFKSAMQGSAPIVIEIKGKNLENIEEVSKYIQENIANIGGIYGVRTSLSEPSPETKVNVIQDRAALYNLSTGVISQAAHAAIKGAVATKFKEEGKEIDIRVRLRNEDRSKLSNLRNILIHSPLDIEVPLSEVAYITQGVGPSEIKRLDQQRVILVTANLSERPLNKVIKDVEVLIKETEETMAEKINASKSAEKDITITLSGESQQMGESFSSLAFALMLSILLVYMIMASQFESLWQPFIIMFTMPLSLTGVFAILFITRTPISVVVMLGVIILGGIVVNNGIILIDCINALVKEGKTIMEAAIESGSARLRPIIMTTMTTVLGLFPLALGISEGSELQSPMAITVMGGLTISTILTLFVIPCIYTLVADFISSRVLKVQPIAVSAVEEPAVLRPGEIRAIMIPPPNWLAAKPPREEKIDEPIEEREGPMQEEGPVIGDAKVPKEIIVKEGSFQLNRRQKKLLEHLKTVDHITRKEYAVLFNISIATAARDLKELLENGSLTASGPLGPGRWYELKMGNG